MTVHARNWGVSLEARITEIAESYDANGQSIDVTFGRGLLTLSQKMRGGT